MRPTDADAVVFKTLWEAAQYLTPEEISERTGLAVECVETSLGRLEREELIVSEAVH